MKELKFSHNQKKNEIFSKMILTLLDEYNYLDEYEISDYKITLNFIA